MTQNRQKVLHWHCYGKIDNGIYMTLTIGPTNLQAHDINPSQGKPMKDLTISGTTWLGCFDHDPTEFDRDQLQPLEFQRYFPDGSPRPLDDEEFERTLHHSNP